MNWWEWQGGFAQDVRYMDMECKWVVSFTASILQLQHSDIRVFERSGGFSSLVKWYDGFPTFCLFNNTWVFACQFDPWCFHAMTSAYYAPLWPNFQSSLTRMTSHFTWLSDLNHLHSPHGFTLIALVAFATFNHQHIHQLSSFSAFSSLIPNIIPHPLPLPAVIPS